MLMRKKLHNALSRDPSESGGAAAQPAALRKLFQAQAVERLRATARAVQDASELLTDPPLPGERDAARWWPEPPPQRSPRLLISPREPLPTTRPGTADPAVPPALSLPSPMGSPRRALVGDSRPGTARADEPPSRRVALTAPPAGGDSRPTTAASTSARSRPGTAASRPGTAASRPGTAASRAGAMEQPGASIPFAQPMDPELQTATMRAVLSQWMDSYHAGEETFASRAVFVEMRLRQALASSAALGTPNVFRCAIVCDAWERVAPLTGRFEGMLHLLWTELLRCLYADYSDDLVGSGAKRYADRTPYFVEVQRLRMLAEESAEKTRLWQRQREDELRILAERNKSINHTLSAWNRALGFVAGARQKAGQDALREQLSSLASTLSDANTEADRLSQAAFTDPLSRCAEAFEALGRLEQRKALQQFLLPSEAAPEVLRMGSAQESAKLLGHLMSSMEKKDLAEVIRASSDALDASARLAHARALLEPHDNGTVRAAPCTEARGPCDLTPGLLFGRSWPHGMLLGPLPAIPSSRRPRPRWPAALTQPLTRPSPARAPPSRAGGG